MTATDTLETPRAAPVPIPVGRGRYRLVVYPRQFSTALPAPATFWWTSVTPCWNSDTASTG